MNIIVAPDHGRFIVNPSRADPRLYHTVSFSARAMEPVMANEAEERVACFTIGLAMDPNVKFPKTNAAGKLIKDLGIYPLVHEFERLLGFLDMVYTGTLIVPDYDGKLNFRTMNAADKGEASTIAIRFLL